MTSKRRGSIELARGTSAPAVPARQPEFDAVVVGAGITGMYQVYLLREMGCSVRGYEVAPDVGGTWYWNRYPGCRLDTESYAYGYFTLIGLVPDWKWSERFAGQPELLRYARAAADRMRVRENYRFDTKVLVADYDEPANVWRLELSTGEAVTCRYLICAAGPLSVSRMPDIPGIDAFEGESAHSSNWPHGADDGPKTINFSGKRVGVIGTGATAVQIIPIVAQTAKHLFVFQRTPNWCTPLGNYALTEQSLAELQGEPRAFLEFLKTTPTAFPYDRNAKKGSDATPQERQALFEELYALPGYRIWLSGYRDLLTSSTSNAYLSAFVADKIRSRVKDPVLAEKLIPKNHGFGTKRVPMETNYYETYNRDNVSLVDLTEEPIERITATGIQLRDRHIELEVIVYATGFDAVTGAIEKIDVRGRNDVALKEVWEDGPLTYLGLQTAGFPNFFMLIGPHNGASFCNIGVCGALQAEWVARMIGYMRGRGLEYSEPDPQYQAQWTERVYDDFSKTLLANADAWWVKKKVLLDGTVQRRALVYVGGAPEYRAHCDTVASKGYEGFLLK